MANEKDLPDWAVVGAEVLYITSGDEPRATHITRVTKTSAFVGDRRFVVGSKWDRKKDRLEEWGQTYSWRSAPTIRPLGGDEAKSILRRKIDRAKAVEMRDALQAAFGKFKGAGGEYYHPDFEAELESLTELQALMGAYILHAERRIAQQNSQKTSGGSV